jgi:CRISPR-associated protein Cmr1
LRIEPSWDAGKLSSTYWPTDFGRVVTTRTGGSVPSDVYLGYGPIQPDSRQKQIRRAIGTDDATRLRLMLPQERGPDLLNTLTLIEWFGAVGSRSRNGWGSLQLRALGATPAIPPVSRAAPLLQVVCRNWEECYSLDWPHAIGADATGPLVWRTAPLENWRAAISALAQVRVGRHFCGTSFT